MTVTRRRRPWSRQGAGGEATRSRDLCIDGTATIPRSPNTCRQETSRRCFVGIRRCESAADSAQLRRTLGVQGQSGTRAAYASHAAAGNPNAKLAVILQKRRFRPRYYLMGLKDVARRPIRFRRHRSDYEIQDRPSTRQIVKLKGLRPPT